MHAILKISENYSLSDATWMENTQLQMVLSFKTSFCLYNEVLLWKQKLLKMGRHFYLPQCEYHFSPKAVISNPASERLLGKQPAHFIPLQLLPPPHYLLQVMFGSQKNIETLRAPEEGGEGNPKRTNFGHKCFKASIFHTDYDFEVHLIIFYHSHFS